jgi:hypothetical protein
MPAREKPGSHKCISAFRDNSQMVFFAQFNELGAALKRRLSTMKSVILTGCISEE